MLSHRIWCRIFTNSSGPAPFPLSDDEIMLCFLPLYHIYGLTCALNPMLTLGQRWF